MGHDLVPTTRFQGAVRGFDRLNGRECVVGADQQLLLTSYRPDEMVDLESERFVFAS